MGVSVAVFDVDGVIYPFRSAWQRIHAVLGVDASINRELYRSGLITYDEWAYVDVALWLGVSRRWIEAPPKPRRGLKLLCRALDRFRLRIAVSGGLNYTGRPIANCFDYYITNELVYSGDDLAGVKMIVREWEKYRVVDEVIKRHGYSWSDAVAVGDSENDIPIIRSAAYSIAFNPVSDRVARAANIVIRGDLSTLAKHLEVLASWRS